MSETIDYSVWLKLLFIPTIGCLILAALAAEIHFNRKQSIKQSNNKHSAVHPVIPSDLTGPKSNESFTQSFNDRIKHLINQSADQAANQSIGTKPTPNDQPSILPTPSRSIQLNIINSDGVSQVFTIEANDALQTIVTAYFAQSNNQTNEQSDKVLTEHSNHDSDEQSVNQPSHQAKSTSTPNGRPKDAVTPNVSKPSQSSTQLPNSSTNQFIKQLASYSFSPAIHQTIHQSINQSNTQPVVLRYQGRRLPLDRSPSQLGLLDQSIIHIEPDFLALFTLIRRQINQTTNQLNREYLIEKNAKEQAEQSINQFHTRLQSQAQHIVELKQKTESLNQSVKDMEHELISVQSQIDSVNQSTKKLTESMHEVDHGSNDLITTRQSLEDQEKILSNELASRMKEVDELKAKQSVKINERNAIKQKWRDSLRDIEAQEKELQVWKTKASRINQSKDKIERIEKQIADQATYQAKIEANQTEMKQLDEDIAAIQARQSIKQAKEKELQAVKQRLKQLERDTKDGQKWKQTAKQLEGQMQEVERSKSALKQGKAREKALELQMKELHHWRQRARAFEREVKELRGWKRARVEYARLRGELDWIPEFPIEGALDSSGGSDYGMSTSESMHQSMGQSSSMNSTDDQAAFFDSIRLSNNLSSNQSNHMVEFDFGDDQHDMLQYALDPSLHNYENLNSSNQSLNQSVLYSNLPDHDEPFDLQTLLNRIDPSMNQPVSQTTSDVLNPTITSPLRQSVNHTSNQSINPLNLSMKPSMHHLTQSSNQPVTQLLSQPVSHLNNSSSASQSILHSHIHQPVLPLHSPTHQSINQSINQSHSQSLSQSLSSSTNHSDDENELLTAGRSDRSIKQSINQSILSSKWPYESLNQQLSPIHQAMNSAISPLNQSINSFRWSNQSSTSPLLIIDDRARANSTDSSWSRLYSGRDQSMSQTLNDLPPGLARFNSPLVIIDDVPDRQKHIR